MARFMTLCTVGYGMEGVFVLKCEGENYYVAHSNDVNKRIDSYLDSGGPQWLDKYEAVDLVSKYKVEGESLRKEFAKEKALSLMMEHGHNSVRGGGWWQSYEMEKPPVPIRRGHTVMLSVLMSFDGVTEVEPEEECPICNQSFKTEWRMLKHTRLHSEKQIEEHDITPPYTSTGNMGGNWSKQRELTLERDDYECRICGFTEDDHKTTHGQSLEIHHITPRKEFGETPEERDHVIVNSLDNLVTLCGECHSKYGDRCGTTPIFTDVDVDEFVKLSKEVRSFSVRV